jgi:Ca-activated chloride channel homolog
MKRIARAAGGIILTLAFIATALTIGLRGQQAPVFRTGVDVVRVDVLVTEGGRPVSGLTAADFEVSDNGVPQQVELATAAASVKVVLVLDTSGSVAGEKLEHLKAGCRALFRGLRAGDTAALLTFSERLVLHVRDEGNIAKLEAAVGGVEASGRTAMRDALYAGLSLAAPDTSRTLLILFSDGLDNSSWLRAPTVIDSLKRSMVVVYAVDASSSVPGSNLVLGQVAETSGGQYLEAAAGEGLVSVFVGILEQFRARYLLTYTATGVKRGDGWHSLKVRLKSKKGSVKARPGYFSR